MSRTIRRKTGNRPQWLFFKWERVPGKYYYHRSLRNEEEVYEELVKFHSDHGYGGNRPGPNKWFRQIHDKSHRMKAKTELVNFCKDENYEVQLRDKPRLGWW